MLLMVDMLSLSASKHKIMDHVYILLLKQLKNRERESKREEI